ncbi:MAG: cysteine--tRNA ligase [Methanobrevibacter sp.]|jgi:cysteinyl-tRNA synthetase|nr:cysteine--tRNA ligase [Methanobrevibacter sp.]
MLEIYNTMNREKEKFVSQNDDRVNLFVCGPTVYDDAHIGHGRTYISFDMIKRYLEFIGYSVFYLENITDVDDKIVVKAREMGLNFETLARFYENRFKEDMYTLNVDSVNFYPRATSHLKEIYKQIDILLEKGFAYETDYGIYFETAKFPDYGKLSNQRLDKLETHREIAKSNKKSPYDFALWKKTNEKPYFTSKWGNGRPGWHIEDTAITAEYFGSQYDIHGGGLDLIFPHHESEIAQMESISSLEPMVKYWLHTGFLNVEGEKMSKSLGNFITIREILKDWDPMVFRLFILSTHYRNPIDFSFKALNQASKNMDRLKKTVNNLIEFQEILDKSYPKRDEFKTLQSKPLKDELIKYDDLNHDILVRLNDVKKEFFKHMDDDFNTPRSLAAVLNFTKNINSFINENISKIDIDENQLKIAQEFIYLSLRFLMDFDEIFNLNLFKQEKSLENQELADNLLDIILKTRDKIRDEKNYQLSDYIREQINELGINIEDR